MGSDPSTNDYGTATTAKMSLVSGEKSNFQYILRLLNTNVEGKQKVMYALTKIKGVGRRYSNLVCKKADVDLTKRAGELTSEELERIVTIIQNPTQYKIPSWYSGKVSGMRTWACGNCLCQLSRKIWCSWSRAVMYLMSPLPKPATSSLTVSVRATGEKTARLPLASLTMVPLPPILILPKRRKGVEQMRTSGVILRMIMTFSGSAGMSLLADEAMVTTVGGW